MEAGASSTSPLAYETLAGMSASVSAVLRVSCRLTTVGFGFFAADVGGGVVLFGPDRSDQSRSWGNILADFGNDGVFNGNTTENGSNFATGTAPDSAAGPVPWQFRIYWNGTASPFVIPDAGFGSHSVAANTQSHWYSKDDGTTWIRQTAVGDRAIAAGVVPDRVAIFASAGSPGGVGVGTAFSNLEVMQEGGAPAPPSETVNETVTAVDTVVRGGTAITVRSRRSDEAVTAFDTLAKGDPTAYVWGCGPAGLWFSRDGMTWNDAGRPGTDNIAGVWGPKTLPKVYAAVDSKGIYTCLNGTWQLEDSFGDTYVSNNWGDQWFLSTWCSASDAFAMCSGQGGTYNLIRARNGSPGTAWSTEYTGGAGVQVVNCHGAADGSAMYAIAWETSGGRRSFLLQRQGGGTWSQVATLGSTATDVVNWYRVRVISATDVRIIGESDVGGTNYSRIWKWNGTVLSEQYSVLRSSKNFNDLWMESTTDGWMLDDEGGSTPNDSVVDTGAGWAKKNDINGVGETQTKYTLCAASQDNAWVLGVDFATHWDGTSWNGQFFPGTPTFYQSFYTVVGVAYAENSAETAPRLSSQAQAVTPTTERREAGFTGRRAWALRSPNFRALFPTASFSRKGTRGSGSTLAADRSSRDVT
jgi:hypothetical protein